VALDFSRLVLEDQHCWYSPGNIKDGLDNSKYGILFDFVWPHIRFATLFCRIRNNIFTQTLLWKDFWQKKNCSACRRTVSKLFGGHQSWTI